MIVIKTTVAAVIVFILAMAGLKTAAAVPVARDAGIVKMYSISAQAIDDFRNRDAIAGLNFN